MRNDVYFNHLPTIMIHTVPSSKIQHDHDSIYNHLCSHLPCYISFPSSSSPSKVLAQSPKSPSNTSPSPTNTFFACNHVAISTNSSSRPNYKAQNSSNSSSPQSTSKDYRPSQSPLNSISPSAASISMSLPNPLPKITPRHLKDYPLRCYGSIWRILRQRSLAISYGFS